MYIPSYNGNDSALYNEFMRISQVITALAEHIFVKYYEEPEKPRDGMIVYADGTAWDPGSGSGMYLYSGASWEFLGSSASGGFVDTANSPNTGEIARFTDADTIEGLTEGEFKTAFNLEAGVDFDAAGTADAAVSAHAGAGDPHPVYLTQSDLPPSGLHMLVESGGDGESGSPGQRGLDGAAGSTGATGPIGPVGPIGPALFFLAEDGAAGDPGPPGRIGVDGAAGSPGIQGLTGPALMFLAEDGETGERGPPGSAGTAGAPGSGGDIVYVPTAGDTAVNVTADATIVTRDVTGVAAGDQIIVDAWFTIQNNSAATRVYAITLDFDGLFDIEISTGACAASATLIHQFRVRGICNVRASNLAYAMVMVDGQLAAGIASGTDTTMAATHLAGKGWGTSASDATGTLTVALKVRSANATATQTLRLHHFTIRKVTPT